MTAYHIETIENEDDDEGGWFAIVFDGREVVHETDELADTEEMAYTDAMRWVEQRKTR